MWNRVRAGKRSSIIDPPLLPGIYIYAKREVFIRAQEGESKGWNGSRSKLLDWTLAS